MVVFKMLDDIVLPLSVTVRPPSREKMELEAEVVICTGGAAFELTLLGGSLSLFSRSKMPPRLVPVAFDTVDRTSELWEDLVSCAFSRISLLRGVLPEGRVILYLPSCSGKTRRAFDSTFDETAVVDTVLVNPVLSVLLLPLLTEAVLGVAETVATGTGTSGSGTDSTLSLALCSWTFLAWRKIAIMSPIVVMPISRRYSLFRSISMSIWMRFSTNTCAYVAAAGDGISALVKNFTHVAAVGVGIVATG